MMLEVTILPLNKNYGYYTAYSDEQVGWALHARGLDGTCCMGHAGLCVEWKAAKLGQRSYKPVGPILVGAGLLVPMTIGWLLLRA